MLSPEELKEIDHELEKVPYRPGASIEALYIVQQHRGYVSDENIKDIAEYLGMSAEELDSVATFFNLIFRRPVGDGLASRQRLRRFVHPHIRSVQS